MDSDKKRGRVLLVSASDKTYEYFSALLPAPEYLPLLRARTAGEAKRNMRSLDADVVVIDAPLPDEFGTQLAKSMATGTAGVLLLVKSELYDTTAAELQAEGALTLQKPNSRQSFYSAVKLLMALGARLRRMEEKNQALESKMTDIRTVDRAKWLLMEKRGMDEAAAHYYIEKRAMDERVSRRVIAENIIHDTAITEEYANKDVHHGEQ